MILKTTCSLWVVNVGDSLPSFRQAVRQQTRNCNLSASNFINLCNIADTRKEGKIAVQYGCEGFLGAYEGDVRNHFFACQAGVTVGSVLADGAISACASIRANYSQGNIYTDNFWEVWNSRFAPYRNREWMRTGECADCSFFRYCKGNGMHLRDENGKLMFCHLKRLL